MSTVRTTQDDVKGRAWCILRAVLGMGLDRVAHGSFWCRDWVPGLSGRRGTSRQLELPGRSPEAGISMTSVRNRKKPSVARAW